MRPQVFYVLLLCSYCWCQNQNSAQYLHSAIKDLRNVAKKKNPVQMIITKDPLEHLEEVEEINAENRVSFPENQVPKLSLTKGELMAIYEAAMTKKGEDKVVPLSVGSAEHEFTTKAPDEEEYYYYYIPLKNIFKNREKPPGSSSAISSYSETHYADPYHYHIKPTPPPDTPKTQYNYHTHQVNVKVEQVKAVADKKKALEPLFMAISGFIGMTVMFIVAILCLPKFSHLKPKENYENSSISRVALLALEGQDCTERFRCELGKTAHAFSLYNNRFTKLLKRIAPRFLGRQIEKVGKYTSKKHKCSAIPCKRRR